MTDTEQIQQIEDRLKAVEQNPNSASERFILNHAAPTDIRWLLDKVKGLEAKQFTITNETKLPVYLKLGEPARKETDDK